MNKWRRYLYLVVDEWGQGAYPLRRIDSSTLFFSRNQVKEAATAAAAFTIEETPLPRPQLSFTPSLHRGNLKFIGLFGNGRKKSHLAALEYGGVSHIYDVEHRTMQEIASPNECQFCDPVALAVAESLYVMDREPIPGRNCSFEVLNNVLCKTNDDSSWHCLQPLPFVLEPGYERRFIESYTTSDGGSNILISTPGVGTYSLDVASGSWRKAGDWELPFRGRADFFPEYGVWLGFSSQDNLLCCSSDITAAVLEGAPLDMVWEDLNPPRRWIPRKSHLVYLSLDSSKVSPRLSGI